MIDPVTNMDRNEAHCYATLYNRNEKKRLKVLLRFIYPATVYLYMADSNDPLELELELRELV